MDLSDWSKTIGSFIVSLGGFGAVIGFIANWWGNRIAERISRYINSAFVILRGSGTLRRRIRRDKVRSFIRAQYGT